MEPEDNSLEDQIDFEELPFEDEDEEGFDYDNFDEHMESYEEAFYRTLDEY